MRYVGRPTSSFFTSQDSRHCKVETNALNEGHWYLVNGHLYIVPSLDLSTTEKGVGPDAETLGILRHATRHHYRGKFASISRDSVIGELRKRRPNVRIEVVTDNRKAYNDQHGYFLHPS